MLEPPASPAADPGAPAVPRVVVAGLGPAPEPWQERALAALHGTGAVVGGAGRPDLVVELGRTSPDLASTARLVIRDEDGLGPEHLGAEAFRSGRRSVVVRLLRLDPEGGAATLLEEGALHVPPRAWAASRPSILEAVAGWPARAIAGRTSLAPRPAAPPAGHVRPPPGWQLRAAAVRNLGGRVAAEFTEERWTVGVVDAPAAQLLRGLPRDRVRWLDPPEGGFIADPMALPDDGDGGGSSPPTLLAEAYWFGERRGKIVALDTSGRGRPTPQVVVDRPWHLSYPHLFRHGGETYCLPEQWQARRVQLLRAERFPDRWVEGPVLLDGYAGVDATLHHDGERFWLFCADEDDLPNARLFLFHSETLEGGWRPHPWNPVRCDLRNTRPAGPLFRAEGALWRPAQDCTRTYGGAVVLNRVLELTPDRFREEPAARLAPDPDGPYPDGLHTFCPAGPVTLIDGKRHFLTPSRLLARGRSAWSRRRPRDPGLAERAAAHPSSSQG